MPEELTGREIAELANLFTSPEQATALLAEAGFPPQHVPDWPGEDAASFWRRVAHTITSGVIPADRASLLNAAHRRYPTNPIFAAPIAIKTTAPSIDDPPAPDLNGEQRILRVLFIGASPLDMPRVRALSEFAAIRDAGSRRLRVEHRWTTPAALALVLDVKPDVLHLCCHGGEGKLIFEDLEGYSNPVLVETVIRRLSSCLNDAKITLRAIVLSVCDSADIAELFTPLAGTIIAWRGELDDDCAIAFTREFYSVAVLNPPTLGDAARTAVRQVGQLEPCKSLPDQLVVLPDKPVTPQKPPVKVTESEDPDIAKIAIHVPTIKAGWALFGKRPGSFDDYAVIAASTWPFSPSQFQQIILGYSPGKPPASRKTTADALPWVSFSSATMQKTTYVGIAVQDWTDHTDGTMRAIAFTRYFCIPLDEIGAASSTFSDLYQAVRDIELPWEIADPLTGEPLQLQLPAADPAAVARTVENFGLDRAAAVAAALLEGPVAVPDGRTDLVERLRFLDVVTGLLPLGARAWLAASSGIDSGPNHLLSLTFTQNSRAGDHLVTQRGNYENPQYEPAQRYREELVRLSREKGTVVVVGHLANLVKRQEQQADKALDALAELDLAEEVLRKTHDKSLQPADVRQLGAVNRFGDLSPADRELVLRRYLLVAQADDLDADLDLLAEQWCPGLAAHLVHVARYRLWRDHWPVADLARWATIADQVEALEVFMTVLTPLDADNAASSRAVVIAAEFVADLDSRWRFSEKLLLTVAQSLELAIAVIRQYVTTNPDKAAEWLRRLERSTRSQPVNERWAVVARPFKVALLDATDPVDPTEIAALAQVDRSVVPDLIYACRVRRPGQLERLLPGVLPWLRDQMPKIDDKWATELTELTRTDVDQQAEIDLLLYRLGWAPTRTPDEAAHDGKNPRTEYIDAFVRHAWRANLPEAEHHKLVDALAKRLGHGWSSSESRFEAVLDLLWQVSHSPDGTLSPVTKLLLTTITEETKTRTELLSHRAFARWWDELRKDPELERGASLARLRGMPESASVAAVADSTVQLLIGGCAELDVIAALKNWEYRPPSDQIINLPQKITEGLQCAGHPNPYNFSDQLLADALVSQLVLMGALLQAVIQKDGNVTLDVLRVHVEELKSIHQKFDELIAKLDVDKRDQSSNGRRLRVIRNLLMGWESRLPAPSSGIVAREGRDIERTEGHDCRQRQSGGGQRRRDLRQDKGVGPRHPVGGVGTRLPAPLQGMHRPGLDPAASGAIDDGAGTGRRVAGRSRGGRSHLLRRRAHAAGSSARRGRPAGSEGPRRLTRLLYRLPTGGVTPAPQLLRRSCAAG